MPKFLQSSLSIGLGARLYEVVVRGIHQAKWGRVALLVFLSLPLFWLYDRSKENRVAAKA
jgi:hypothetical protein